ncbi:MAG: MtrB/PioB family decaheme-associated outer membrane protein [Betaproteobacteria bacterium]|nr:MtrB/PioB family decaheme-associated outer membrane protein [Betaproteobacteria bacterium]
MTTSKQNVGFGQTVIALAVLSAFASAAGAQEIDALTAPGNSISVGGSIASGNEKDRARFGMFNGLRNQQGHGLLGFTYRDADSNAGKWFTLEGRNLGLDNREVGFAYRKLGDLKLWGDYSEVVRHDPRTITTGLVGAGTTTPTVVLQSAPGQGSELNLDLKRKSISLNLEKWFDGRMQMEVNFKNEDKNGARLWGRGFPCSSVTVGSTCAAGPTATATGWALLMLPEPVNSTIRQIDMKLNWSGQKLNLSGGYYGSFYTNQNGNLTPTVPGTLVNGLGTALPLQTGLQGILQLPMALWPDNQAQQFYIGGNYKFTPSTKMNFKYSYTHATQNEGFLNMGLTGAPAGRNSLDGVLNKTKAQVGLSSHPLDKLHVHGDLKYENTSNKTPSALYNGEFSSTAATATFNSFTNTVTSPRKWDGKIEASYKLPANYLATGGVHYEHEDFGAFPQSANLNGITGIRQKTKDQGWRLELRKSMSETLTGAVSYGESKRSGDSPWLKPLSLSCQGLGGLANAGTGVIEGNTGLISQTACGTIGSPATTTAANIFNNGLTNATRTGIFPFFQEDRKRNKFKLMTNWTPNDKLSFQVYADYNKDKYSMEATDHGLRDTGFTLYGADATYQLSESWRVTGYWSNGTYKTNAGHSTGYDATLKDRNNSFGLGLYGKPSGRVNVGADLTYLDDRLKYFQVQDPNASATNTLFLNEQGGLPDVTYRLIRLKLFTDYALDKMSYIRADFIYQHTLFNEWTYNFNGVPFFYNDNTTINAKQKQTVNYIGASYVMRFQ